MKVVSGTSFTRSICLLCWVVCFGYGCYSVKHAQSGKAFVFKNNVEVTADVTKSEKKAIQRDLSQQLDDSLNPTVKDFLFLLHTVQNPAVYDTSYAGSSLRTMRYYMVNKGFFSPEEGYTYKIDTVHKDRPKHVQYRVTTNFFVTAGPRTLLDSIVVDLKDPTLQHLADSAKKGTLLIRGDPFNADKITGEVNRLVDIYKNYGYYAISQNAFQVLLDTVNPLLINPTIDPLQRIHLFAEQQRLQKNPTTDLYITLAPELDSGLIKRYFIRQVFIYPDFETTRDNRKTPLTGVFLDSIVLRYHTLKFKPRFLLRNNFLQPGDLYRQDNYNKTLNTLNFLGVWQVPIIQAREVKDTTGSRRAADSVRQTSAADSSQAARTFVTDSVRAIRNVAIDSIRRAELNARVDSALASMDTTHHLPDQPVSVDSALLAKQDTLQKARTSLDSAQAAAREENEALLAGGLPKMESSYHAYAVKQRDSVGQLDFYYLLTPAKKQTFNSNFELNYSNTNDNIANAAIGTGNLFGAATGFGVTNRNVGKEAISMTNTVNGGAQVSPQFGWQLASVDLGYTNTLTIPRFITPFKGLNNMRLLAEQTVVSSNATYVERIGFFDLNNLNFKYGYQWKTRPNVTWSYNPVDVEYSYLYNQTSTFDSVLKYNPFLRFAYTNALIMAQNGDMLYTFFNHRHPNRTSSIHAGLETSGLLAGIARRASNDQLFGRLFQYVRPTLEFKHEIKYRNNNSWNFRLFSGVGIPLGGDTTLPFFKQFVGGGPNSMRAWAFRSLGPGSTHLAADTGNVFQDRFGDIQFEGNIEYRYNIAEIIPNSMYLKGAVFIDVGNVWDFKRQDSVPGQPHPTYDSATLDISHFYQELAVGAGVGFRLDFNYFVLRFDFGFRFKKPDEPLHDGWQFPSINLANVFGRSDADKSWRYNNYNFSFGIGYSF